MSVFEAAAEAWRSGRESAMATVIGVRGSAPRAGGTRMLVYDDGSIEGTVGGGELERRTVEAALGCIASGQPVRLEVHLVRDLGMCCGGRMEVFVEPVGVQESVVIYGAGHVAHAVVPILRALDFRVTVVDDRDELLSEARFADCERIVTDARTHAEAETGSPHRWWLVLTHDHRLDQDLCETLLPKPCAWIGMIGSRGKVARFLVRFRAAGLQESTFAKLCAPVGLDLGAETPAEIAVAIAAEMVRVRRRADRPPIPLSSLPLEARGGDGRASPPAWLRDESDSG